MKFCQPWLRSNATPIQTLSLVQTLSLFQTLTFSFIFVIGFMISPPNAVNARARLAFTPIEATTETVRVDLTPNLWLNSIIRSYQYFQNNGAPRCNFTQKPGFHNERHSRTDNRHRAAPQSSAS